jgi:LysM repeat protein
MNTTSRRALIARVTAPAIFFLCAAGFAQSPTALENFYNPYGIALDESQPLDRVKTFNYQVESGDTLFSIAERFLGNPYKGAVIARVNNIEDPLRLKAGTRIKVPQGRLGILVTVEKQDKECGVTEVPLSHTFRAGDRFQVRVAANVDGYLYIYNQAPNGDLRPVLPREGGKPQRVRQFREYMLPGDGWFRFDSEKGSEELMVLVSLQPLTGLDRDLVAEGVAAKKVRSYLEDEKTKGIVAESRQEAGPSVVLASPVEGATVVAYRLVLRKP